MDQEKAGSRLIGEQRKKKLIIAVPLVIAVFAIVILVIAKLGFKNHFQDVSLLQKGPKVDIKTEYKNPFDQKTQYVNPFDEYKNPFIVSK